MFRHGCLLLVLLPFQLFSQVVSGPMIGHTEMRDVTLWLEVSPDVKQLQLEVAAQQKGYLKKITYAGSLGKEFNPVHFTVGGLEPNTIYNYTVWVNGRSTSTKGSFKTKQLWQHRQPVPDITFLAGSCAFLPDSAYDDPKETDGRDLSIFSTMAKEKASFMLWLGDNWYTREVDYASEWGLWSRAHRDRKHPALQKLFRVMPHYAIWDDHDYGPNDRGKSYMLKESSREVFQSYWANPSYGMNGQGIYTRFSHGDADFFLCDARWWRSADQFSDSVDGAPNPYKKMLGDEQLEWLMNALLESKAAFKFVAMGSQVLNTVSKWDRLSRFPAEYNRLMSFLKKNQIDGVIFLSGDRHHSEIIRQERAGTYALYDITVSPLTSGTHAFDSIEVNNPHRVYGLAQKTNYAQFNISGAAGQRQLLVRFLGARGENLGEWRVREDQLKTPLR